MFVERFEGSFTPAVILPVASIPCSNSMASHMRRIEDSVAT